MVINTGGNETIREPNLYDGLSILEIKRLNYPLWAHQLAGLYLLIISVVGFLMNCGCLYTFRMNKELRTPTNIFIIGMTVSHLLHIVFGNTLSWISALNGSLIAGPAGCTVAAFMVFLFGASSLYQLTAVSVDRYIVICNPLIATKITKRVAVVAVIGCHLGGLFWSTLPFTGWATYGPEATGVSCGLDHRVRSFSTTTYLICVFLFVFSAPLCVMIYCYHGVYSTVRSISKMTAFDKESRLAKKNIKIEKKMLRTCIIMCMAFFVSYAPYAMVLFYGAFVDYDSIPLVVTGVPAFIAKSETVWNPIIYVGTNKIFRKAFYNSLPCSGLRDMLTKAVDEDVKEADSKETDAGEDDKGKESANTAANNGNPNAVAPVTSEPVKVEC